MDRNGALGSKIIFKSKSRSFSSSVDGCEVERECASGTNSYVYRLFLESLEESRKCLLVQILERRITEPEPPRSRLRSRAERTVIKVLLQSKRVPRLSERGKFARVEVMKLLIILEEKRARSDVLDGRV